MTTDRILNRTKLLQKTDIPIRQAFSALELEFPKYEFHYDDVYAAPYSDGTVVIKYDIEYWLFWKLKRR